MAALLNTKKAAEYLGFSEPVLRLSRAEGNTLSGIEPPPHVKIGTKTIRYQVKDLDEWINKLGNSSTAK